MKEYARSATLNYPLAICADCQLYCMQLPLNHSPTGASHSGPLICCWSLQGTTLFGFNRGLIELPKPLAAR